MSGPAPVRVAIVGAGKMAREHARAFKAIPGVVLAGIHSRTRARAEALAFELGIPRVYDSLAELHEATRADLAVVTVFEAAMKAVALACLDLPWALLLEKPPGLDVAEAEDIARRARARERRVWVGLNRQWLSSTQAALGELASVEGTRFVKVQDQQNLAQAAALGHPPEVVRHWMYANSIHLVDYFRILARGEVVKVDNVLRWDLARPGPVVAFLRFASGDLGLYEALWHAPGPWAATVTAAGQRWELRPLESLTTQRLGERPASREADPRESELKAGFRLQAEKAVAALRGGPDEMPSIDDALRTMHLIRAIYGA